MRCWILRMVILVLVGGCGGHVEPARAGASTSGSQTKPPTSLVPADPKITEAKAIKAQGLDLRAKLQDLAKHEGPKVRRTARVVEDCRNFECVKRLGTFLKQKEPLAYLIGVGLFATKPFERLQPVNAVLAQKNNITMAQAVLKRAEEFIQERADRAEADVTNAKMAEAALGAAEEACTDPKECQTKCDTGDGPACVVVGNKLMEQDKLSEALEAYQTGCKAGFEIACGNVRTLGVMMAKREAAVSEAWADVESAVDELVGKQYQLKFASKHLQGPRRARTLQMMREHVAAYRTEVYCPAATTFIKAHGKAEFRERAKHHCDERPPSMTGISGAEVELRSECRAAYAITCR